MEAPEEPKRTRPLLEEYRKIRAQLEEDAFLFMRLGHFYELFDDDAERFKLLYPAHVVTHYKGAPMLGVPKQAMFETLCDLRRAGYKVGVVEDVLHKKGPEPLVPRKELIEFR